MLLLNVPYEEKDVAKRLGARWNPNLKKWYVKDRVDYPKFKKFITKSDSFCILYDEFYIIKSKRIGYSGKTETPIIGYGVNKFMTYTNNTFSVSDCNCINVPRNACLMPKPLLNYMQNRCALKKRFPCSNVLISDIVTGNDGRIQKCSISFCEDCINYNPNNLFIVSGIEESMLNFMNNKKIDSRITVFPIPLIYDIVLDKKELGCSPDEFELLDYKEYESYYFPHSGIR